MRQIVVLIMLLNYLVGTSLASLPLPKVEFEDAAVLDVVRILAKQAGLNLVVSGNGGLDQTKRTTLHLKNVTAEEALEYVLKTNDMTFERKGSAVLVSMLLQDPEAKGEIETMSLKYLSAEKISSLLARVLPVLKTSMGGSANSIVLKGRGEMIDEARKLISSVDLPIPQILIECKVLEISESDSMHLGLSYGEEAGTIQFLTDKDTRKTSAVSDLQTTLNGFISNGQAKIVASPKIATLDDHQAVLNIGSRIPYAVPVSSTSGSTQWTVEYIEAGVKLKITPRLGEAGYITTSIQPEVSSVSEWRTTAAGDFPVISSRNAQATLRVKDGETIVVLPEEETLRKMAPRFEREEEVLPDPTWKKWVKLFL